MLCKPKLISGLKKYSWGSVTKMKQLTQNVRLMPTDWRHLFLLYNSCPLCCLLSLAFISLTCMILYMPYNDPSWSLRNVQIWLGHNLIVNSNNCKIPVLFPFSISEIIFWELILTFWFLDLKEFSRNNKYPFKPCQQLLHVIFPLSNTVI